MVPVVVMVCGGFCGIISSSGDCCCGSKKKLFVIALVFPIREGLKKKHVFLSTFCG